MARKQHHLGMGHRKLWREQREQPVTRELREQIELLKLKLRGNRAEPMLTEMRVLGEMLEQPVLPELRVLEEMLEQLEFRELEEMPEQPVLQERRGPIRWKMKLNRTRMQLMALLTFKTTSKGENWVTVLGWFIPRKYRHVIGDILEDCAEMRETGCTESRIKFHVVYQWLIAVLTLVPTAVKTSITDILKQVISPPK